MNYEYWDVVSRKKVVVDRRVDDRENPPTFEEVQEFEDIDMSKDEYDSAKWERVFTGGCGWTKGPNYGTQGKGTWGSND